MTRTLLALAAVFALCSGVALADPQPQTSGPHATCRPDVEKLCPGVQPGGGRIIGCLKQNQAQLSDACKAALAKRAQARGAPGANAPPPQ